MAENKYTMDISPNMLKHLGIGLYSNIPAVLSEAVANAWDADAPRVVITTDRGKITVEDDGEGMTVEDANKKYLRVGYDRRVDAGGRTAKRRRPVMGRKGISNLSLFSIADTVTVYSAKGGDRHGFRMTVKGIEDAGARGATYSPDSLPPAADLAQGTRIVLTDLKKQARKVASLRQKIARRFTVIGDDFEVILNGREITAEDRGYHNILQYAWTLGPRGKAAVSNAPRAAGRLDSAVRIGRKTAHLDGWVGTVAKPSSLKDAGERSNRIAVMVRGKMAQEDILEEMGEHGVYRSYVIGEIHADFMDVDGEEDAVTTSRQKLKEDDSRYQAMLKTVHRALKQIEGEWTDFRNAEGVDKACETGYIREWYDSLPAHFRKSAKSILGRINAMRIDDDEDRRRLFLGGILAFESLKLRNMLDRIGSADITPVSLDRVFEQVRDLEATAYYQITKDRMDVITKLNSITERNEKERVIQKHLYQNLWLLEPTWSHATEDKKMETTIKNAMASSGARLTGGEKRARLDLKYTTVAGKHVVIELKRPRSVISTDRLEEQIRKYWRALRKIVDVHNLEFVCVVGSKPREWIDDSMEEENAKRRLGDMGARVVTYDMLISHAERAYAEYTQSKKGISRVYTLIANMKKDDRKRMGPA